MFEKFSENVFSFVSTNGGSNVFLLVGGKEIALIDSSILENSSAIVSGLSSLGFRPGDVSLVLHTHGHADHFGCDSLFENAKIGMHVLDAERINEGDVSLACRHYFPDSVLPMVSLLFEAGHEIDLGGFSLRVLHAPGHTAGSSCFFLEGEKALFSGDFLFKGGFGRTDLPSGSAMEMLESLKGMQGKGFEALFPGHGGLLFGLEENRLNLGNAVKMASTNTFL